MRRKNSLPIPIERAYDVPFVANNSVRSAVGGSALLVAVLEVGDGFLCIEWQLGMQRVELTAVKRSQFPHFFNLTQDDLSDVVTDLKSKALNHFATLGAIQLLAELTPLTREEEIEMAKTPAVKAADTSKLSKKTAAAAPAAKEPKTGGVGRVPAEFDYKVVKGAKNECRENSWAYHMIDTIMANTSTTDARAANAKAKGATPKGQNYSDKALDFAWAKEKGYITY